MKYIPLTQDLVATVDDSDYEVLADSRWLALRWANGTYHAARSIVVDGKRTFVYIARIILGIDDKTSKVRFIDGDTLNLRRSNLEVIPRNIKKRSAKQPASARDYNDAFNAGLVKTDG